MLAAAHLLNGLLMIAIPLILGVVLARRWRLSWGLFGVGAATFVASQLLHIPFNNLVLTPFVTERGMFAAGGLAFVTAALWHALSSCAAGHLTRETYPMRSCLERVMAAVKRLFSADLFYTAFIRPLRCAGRIL